MSELPVVLATANPDKARELAAVLAVDGVRLLGLDDLPGWDPIEETGSTIEENALEKARAVSYELDRCAAADDTGLFVAALGGRPGHRAARYAGEHASYADNVARLLEEMRDVPLEKRGAVFRCVIAVHCPDGTSRLARGACYGRILFRPRGEGGFGYDPVFLVESLGRTFAELSSDVKNVWSHRARAASAARRILADLAATARASGSLTLSTGAARPGA